MLMSKRRTDAHNITIYVYVLNSDDYKVGPISGQQFRGNDQT
jgi:hypothetical protein